jgi:putative tRNA adenosine deaminase-associated protein
MPYFSAVLACRGSRWEPRDVDLDELADLGELADRLRMIASDSDEPVILVLEHEDDWFALVRVDGEEDPRVFVSDVRSAARSPYAETLGLGPDSSEEEEPDPAEGPGGDVDLFADLGTSPEDLEKLCLEGELPTGDALAALAESAGFADELDAMR